jgi:hypothetical protein
MLADRVRLKITIPIGGGTWEYSASPQSRVVKYFDVDEEQDWLEFYHSDTLIVSTPFTSFGIDSLVRQYHEVGGYRYTRGRTLIDLSGGNEYYKICKTTAGVEAPGSGD